MNSSNFKNYEFDNEVLTCESLIKGFDDEIFNKFELKAKKINLGKKIKDLFDGKKVNNSEDQAAWHTKYRAERNQIDSSEKYSELFDSATNIVNIGIGGSFEGPKLLIESIGSTKFNHLFITGPDEIEFEEKIKSLKPEDTIFIVSSKSFKTIETIEIFKIALMWSGDINKFIAITANKSEALKYDFKNIIEFDKEIGGRYSIWSDVSLAAQMENNTELKEKFIEGGRQADQDLIKNDEYFKFLKYLSYSDIWLNNFKLKNTRVVLSYIWYFRSLPDYIQQLEMESLGKKSAKDSDFKKTGQVVFGGYGPRAQHSYFQLLHQGTQELCADIIACSEDKNNLSYAQAFIQSKLLSKGSSDTLNEEEKINGNVPLNFFLLKKVDPYSLGYLIASWEHRTFISAKILEINPFDQFGVNAGKIYTNKYLADKD